MAASIILAALWFSPLPLAHIAASKLMGGNKWLSISSTVHVGIASIANEIFLSGMVFGHLGATLLPRQAVRMLGLLDLSNSLNPPIWTLHLEFYGSVLVLGLVRLQGKLSLNQHRTLCGVLFLVLIAHPLDLFVIGYLAAKMLRTTRWHRLQTKRWFKASATLALLLGLIMSLQIVPSGTVAELVRFSNATHLQMRLTAPEVLDDYGAIFIFFGILALPALQNMLSASLGQLLGRYSFSLYLVHFPILFTLGAAIFIWLQPLGLGFAVIVACLCGFAATISITVLFERWVDQPAIALSRRIRIFDSDAAKIDGKLLRATK